MLEARSRATDPNGMLRAAAEELRALIFEGADAFGMRLGPQPASAFPALRVQMPTGVKPARGRARPMRAAKRAFARAEAAALEKRKVIAAGPPSSWAHPAHAAPKAGPAQLQAAVGFFVKGAHCRGSRHIRRRTWRAN